LINEKNWNGVENPKKNKKKNAKKVKRKHNSLEVTKKQEEAVF